MASAILTRCFQLKKPKSPTSPPTVQVSGLTPYTLRHRYCAACLQTLDGGAPVSAYTVGKEMGHGGDALVKRVYGLLGAVRHRGDAVEFRVEQHPITLRKHISRLPWGRLPFQRQPESLEKRLSA